MGAVTVLMKTLAVAGTAAMFLVGGGILLHGLGPLHLAVRDQIGTVGAVAGVARTVLPLCIEPLASVVAGSQAFLGLGVVARLRNKAA